jgi:putative AdoMet-dependent methyltransferase
MPVRSLTARRFLICVGTGNFTDEFYTRNAQCYGVDFSEKMLKIASSKMPSAYLVQHDLRKGVPVEFERAKFSVILSAYVLHHFQLEKKLEIISDYLKMLKKEDGKMFIVDISFRTRADHDQYKKKMGDSWDSSEFYFIADETIGHFKNVEYKQFSECGGLYTWSIGEK